MNLNANENVTNHSYVFNKNNSNIQREMDNLETFSNYDNKSQYDNNAFSTKSVNHLKDFNKNTYKTKLLKKEAYSQSYQNLQSKHKFLFRKYL